MASSGETAAHKQLKRAALEWAQVRGFAIGGLEVRVPNCRYRADAAAYRPAKQTKNGAPQLGETVVFECKQARPDFLSDAHPERETRERLADCRNRLAKLSQLLGTHHPHLRKGDSLFPEYESHDFSGLEHEGYRKLVDEIRLLESRLLGKTKFAKLVRYRCASFFYLVVEEEILTEREVPLDWGLLLRGADGELRCVRKAAYVESPELHRLQLLERLGSAGTRLFNERESISYEEIWEARRKSGE